MVASESGTIVTGTMTRSVAKVVVMVVVVMPWMIPVVVVVPTPVVAIPVVGTIPVVVVIPPGAVVAVVVRIVVTVAIRIEAPIPCIAHIDVGVPAAVAAGVVVIVVVHGGAGACAKTLDAGSEVLVIVGLGGGVNHTIGVGHRLGGLVYGIDIGLVVLAVRVICLIVVCGVAADAGGGAAATARVLSAGMVVRRVVGVVVSHLLVGGAADGHYARHQYRNYSNCFHFVMYFDLISYFCNLKNESNNTNIIPRWQKN
jgi:hypothetical protein